MRIVSGIFGGRKLYVPKGRDIRPTTDKIRGAIFNALRSRGVVEGATVLDYFCGSGALGLEALSQGAKACTFIDKSRTSLDTARRNAAALGLEEDVHFLLKDITKLGPRPDHIPPASLIFLDPPYEQGFLSLSLNILYNQKWLKEEALLVLEAEKRFELELADDVTGLFKVLDERIYKDTKILTLSYISS